VKSFKPTNGNKILHQVSNDNGVRIVNLAHQKMLLRAWCVRTETFISTWYGRKVMRLIFY